MPKSAADSQEAGVTTFATKIQYAKGNGTLKASGPLEFLNNWESKLGRWKNNSS